MASSVILKANNLSILFGGLKAVGDFSIELKRGELAGLIGPNGAGKTTIFNMLSGIYTPSDGEITFWDDNDNPHKTSAKSPADLNKIGIARTFQNIRLFGSLSVEDNVRIALHPRRTQNPFDVLFRLPRFAADEKRMGNEVDVLLSLFKIDNKKNELAKNLPYGEQRKLEIARALASKPSLLLLDEPAAGMNPQETIELMNLISTIRRDFNLTILLIEHDMHLVMGICERLIVVDYGHIIAQGSPHDIKNNPNVIKAYLGDLALNAGKQKISQNVTSDDGTEADSVAAPPRSIAASRSTTLPPLISTDVFLEVKDLKISYGNIIALHNISFTVQKGEIITLIGGNGAGKTTTLHGISGIRKKTKGSITFNGRDITNLSADRIVCTGLAQVPEGRRIFANLSVRDNLEMGAFTRFDGKIKNDFELVYEMFPRLRERAHQFAGTLSGGEQQMLAMGRALMARPSLLLLDEPSMGLSPILVDEIFRIIKRINKEGMTVLLVEQNAYQALSIADRAYVLETGNIIKSGMAGDLIKDPSIIEAYLG